MSEILQLESILNKDYESVNLVLFQEWIESFDKLSKLAVGIIVGPSGDSSSSG